MKSLRILIVVLSFLVSGYADEAFLKPNDVIALVGGEDMVALGESGLLEVSILRASPDYRLKIRSLAWEGDTVFEQARMLNYPKLEQQLDEIKATVAIVQFGQMERMAGKPGLNAFATAYEALIARIKGEPERRIVLLEPTPVAPRSDPRERESASAYAAAVAQLSERIAGARFVALLDLNDNQLTHRDGIHLLGHSGVASAIATAIGARPPGDFVRADYESLSRVIAAKNRLWDRYRRPQNWAFLAGDRITQASSRDHLDPKKRWFPEEMKEFIPLIDAKEQEIWELAAKLASEKK